MRERNVDTKGQERSAPARDDRRAPVQGKHSALRAAAIFAVAAALAATSVGALVACSGNTVVPIKEPDNCKQQIIGMSIIASERLNPTECGDSRPVQLRIYQLKTDIRLQNASFDEIWKKDKETLKDDLIKVDEMTVYPDSRQEIKFERDDAALIVAGVALFRDHRGRSWYTTFELPPPAGKGNCGFPKCADGSCSDGGDAGRVGNELGLKYSLWLFNTRIESGEDHLDDFPDGGKIKELMQHEHCPASPGAPVGPPPPQGGKGIQ
jgi:type VI secretion system protein VasD